jgi:uncharacterized protein YbjT (DUF2867 family)
MAAMEIAVMGATGNVGRELVGQLAARGEQVRALSRSDRSDWPEGVTGFAVDMTDGASLRPALDGVEAAFMMSGYDDAGIVAEVERAGARRVTLLSSSSVPTAGPDNAVAAYHRASEQALRDSTLAWSFLRPNTFMSNALKWAEPIAAGRPLVVPFADVPIASNDPADVAAVAVATLTGAVEPGEAHRISGPEALLPARQVEILAEILGLEIAFEAEDDATARARMEAEMPTPYVDAFFEFFVDGKIDETTVRPTVEQLTGRPPRTFRAWAEAHADSFA